LSDNAEAPGHHSRCPRCGLALEVVARDGARDIAYDFAAWNRLCKAPMLGGPSMCLAQACTPPARPVDQPAERGERPSMKPFG
jgi:hypothetical protein